MSASVRPHSPSTTAVPRRTLIAAGAWTVPVVAAATAAPAYAASNCNGGTARAVTWQTNSPTDTNPVTNTTQVGTVAGNTLSVGSTYTGTAGSRAVRNMASYSVTTTNDSFELSNNIPPAGTANIEGNYQTATFTFGTRVQSVTFTIDDIDRASTGQSAFADRVAIIPGTSANVSGVGGADITGSGTTTSPWQTTTETGAYEARQSVDVTIIGAFTSFSIKYWSYIGAPASAQMWIRIRNMQVRTCV